MNVASPIASGSSQPYTKSSTPLTTPHQVHRLFQHLIARQPLQQTPSTSNPFSSCHHFRAHPAFKSNAHLSRTQPYVPAVQFRQTTSSEILSSRLIHPAPLSQKSRRIKVAQLLRNPGILPSAGALTGGLHDRFFCHSTKSYEYYHSIIPTTNRHHAPHCSFA
jgi:hypothetical protein